MVCTAYSYTLTVSMIAAIAARWFDFKPAMFLLIFASYLLACCSPLVLVLNGSMLFAVPFVAEHAWLELKSRWWIVLVIGIVAWALSVLALPAFVFLLGF